MFCGKDRFILNVWFRMIRQEVLPGSEKYGQVVQEEFLAEGISVKAYVPMEVYSQI